jgi:pyruvate/2-oxoglutarate/acetoin dehydrogenase E1 component
MSRTYTGTNAECVFDLAQRQISSRSSAVAVVVVIPMITAAARATAVVPEAALDEDVVEARAAVRPCDEAVLRDSAATTATTLAAFVARHASSLLRAIAEVEFFAKPFWGWWLLTATPRSNYTLPAT